jgi:D-alanyl-D-alanine dipeptidase
VYYLQKFAHIKTPGITLISIGFFLIASLGPFHCNREDSSANPIPANSQQMIVVITQSFDSAAASLYLYQKNGIESEWQLYAERIPAIVGKNGLGWGLGLHMIPQNSGPAKQEGDGKSPAGIFSMSSVFGFTPAEQMTALKMPYQHIRELIECVDDPNSVYYNTIIHRDQARQVDWNSSERMWRAQLWYDLGVVVDHNKNPAKKNAGSCIFLHYWANPQDSTSGCTAMSRSDMKNIVNWLDQDKHPILVQLPREMYDNYMKIWELPEIPIPENPHQEENQEKKSKNNSNAEKIETYLFDCEKGFTFTVRIENETAWLFLTDTAVALKRVDKASKNMYQAGQYAFRQQGNTSRLLIGNQVYENCRNNPSRAVWEAAKLNGVSFRAVGNEPGWSLEITDNKNIILITNYGRDKYHFKTPPPKIDEKLARTFYHTKAEGNSLTVIIENKACMDSMDGLGFENAVTVVLNGQKLVGCGRSLH